MMTFLGRKSSKTLRCDSDKVPVPVGRSVCLCNYYIMKAHNFMMQE